MNRNEFLKSVTASAITICAASCFENCTNNNVAPINVDFIIDLSQAPYTALQSIGGSVIKSSIIIGRVSSTEFAAVAKTCTHAGSTVEFQLSNSRFHCPNHGANFSLTGSVLNGPASSNLQKFNTTLTGTQLRVFS